MRGSLAFRRLSQAAKRANDLAWLARPRPATAATAITTMIALSWLRGSRTMRAATASPITTMARR